MNLKTPSLKDVKESSKVPHTENREHLKYRPDIDGLRAIAIIAVVIFHAFPSMLSGGFAGVDVFFVISGFLISSIIFRSLHLGTFSFVDFYSRRAKRIFPALVVVLLSTYVFGWFALLPDEFKQLGKHVAAGTLFFQNFNLLGESGYFDTSSELKPLMHLWSLAIEEQFYLIYPLIIWGAWRIGLNVIFTITSLCFLSFCLNIYGVGSDPVNTFFAPHTRFWELLVGAILAYFYYSRAKEGSKYQVSKFFSSTLSNAMSLLGLVFIVFAVVFIDSGNVFPGWWALLPVMGTGMLILAGPGALVNRTILSNRFMLFVGVISYPLYLWHWPILSYARIMESAVPIWEIQIAAVLLSILLAWLTYRFVEMPIRFQAKTVHKPVFLWAVMLCIGGVGYATHDQDGFAFRVRELDSSNSQFGWGALTNENCKKAYPAFWAIDHCTMTREGAPSVMLIGDSHSDHIRLGLSEALAKTGENLLNLGVSGCTPFYDVASHPKGVQDWCSIYINKALELAANAESVKTVVLSSRGPMYLTGEGYEEGEDLIHHNRVLELIGNPDVKDYNAVFETGMRSTLKVLAEAGKKVVFVLDVPELGFSPRSCVDSRPLRLTSKIKEPCAVARSEVDARNSEYRKVVFRVLKDFPLVKLFDAQAVLCDSNWCWAMIDNKILYRDDDHLSISGSELMAKDLLPIVTSSLLVKNEKSLDGAATK
ncbi:acyltransferase family protein [Pseudomonas sp. SJZ131]|uniref:acyltransferase family protein n=1 Tax=Pseudomonas sp. SJZ131 TaxID=2572895 RepID=UPI0015B52A5B|nr:acyltransferase family protein [Pseudomonas sp. SJZ131]